MIKLKEIRHDSNITDMYDKIKRSCEESFWVDHGINHIEKVIHTVEYIMSNIECSDEMVECSKIAAFLHDIGCISGKDNHAENSYLISKEYLKDKDISAENKELILEAIRNHSDGGNTLIGIVLAFADKFDHDKGRLEPTGREIEGLNQIQYIERIDIKLENKKIIVNFLASPLFDKEAFSKYYFIPKMIKTTKALCNYLNIDGVIELNGEEWLLNYTVSNKVYTN